MELTLFHLDTYSNRLFGRTPAALSILDHWLPEHTLQRAAGLNAADGITYLVPRGEAMEVRCFTAEQEVELHQRATLATAWFYFHHIAPQSMHLNLVVRDDRLTVYRDARGLTPFTYELCQSQVCITDTMEPFHLQEVTTLQLTL